jgi:hypothetical protein
MLLRPETSTPLPNPEDRSMRMVKRLVAALFLLLGTAGLLLSLAGGVGVWLVKEPVTIKATRVFDRVEAALDRVENLLAQTEASLRRASEHLHEARNQQRNSSRKPQPNNAVRRGLARTVQRKLAPEVGDAQEKLKSVAEAAVVVNSVLEDMGHFPFLSATGLDMGALTQVNKRLADLGPAAWELSRMLGDPEPDSEVDTQFGRIDRGLQTMQRLLADYEPRVREVRQRTEQLRSRVFAWITPVAVLLSAVSFWIAVSQVSILFHAWSWWKGGPAKRELLGAPS